MTTSHYQTETFMSENFVESAGAILFHFTTRSICILRDVKRNEYILPKGRRNVGESRHDTAIRETTEETGIPCRLRPINMRSRVCPWDKEDVPDEARLFHGVREPIAVQMRRIGEGEIKLIWWYIAVVNERKRAGKCEDGFKVEWYSYQEGLEKLTFQNDRELVAKALEHMRNTCLYPVLAGNESESSFKFSW